jgi:hypothetical protein
LLLWIDARRVSSLRCAKGFRERVLGALGGISASALTFSLPQISASCEVNRWGLKHMAVLRDVAVTFFFFFAVVYSVFDAYHALHQCWHSVDHVIQQIFGPAEAKPRVEPPVQQD